jgi:hypothetical protein
METISAGFHVGEFFWCKPKIIIHGDRLKAFFRNTSHGRDIVRQGREISSGSKKVIQERQFGGYTS